MFSKSILIVFIFLFSNTLESQSLFNELIEKYKGLELLKWHQVDTYNVFGEVKGNYNVQISKGIINKNYRVITEDYDGEI